MDPSRAILLLESLHPDAETLIEASALLVRADLDGRLPPSTPWQDVRAILTRGRGRIDRSLMDRCPNLSVVARCGTGLDNVDVAFARARDVTVLHAPGANASTVAEHAIVLMLALLRDVPRMASEVRAGRWQARAGYRGREAAEATLGIIGFGAIGQRVAEIARVLRMHVIVAAHGSVCDSIPTAPLERVLANSDVVSLHAPLTPATRGLIGRDQLAAMKPGAFLVNTARGALIDSVALLEALTSGHLGGFAADVLDPQPPLPGDALLQHPRALVTPHVASLTDATYRQICYTTALRVLAILTKPDPPRSR